MRSASRGVAAVAVALSLVGVLVACSGNKTDTSPADSGAGNGYLADRSKLGGPCAADLTCPRGQRCVSFGEFDRALSEPLCYEGDDPCESVVCRNGRQCVLTLDAPQTAACAG